MAAIQQALASYKAAAGLAYATWNPADKGTGAILSNGNLTLLGMDSVRSTVSKAAGKWYWECTCIDTSYVGIGNSSASLLGVMNTGGAVAWQGLTGTVFVNGSAFQNVNPYGAGAVLGFALDTAAVSLGIYLNNTFQTTLFHGVGGAMFAMASAEAGTRGYTANFGASTMTYAPPAGYNAGLY